MRNKPPARLKLWFLVMMKRFFLICEFLGIGACLQTQSLSCGNTLGLKFNTDLRRREKKDAL